MKSSHLFYCHLLVMIAMIPQAFSLDAVEATDLFKRKSYADIAEEFAPYASKTAEDRDIMLEINRVVFDDLSSCLNLGRWVWVMKQMKDKSDQAVVATAMDGVLKGEAASFTNRIDLLITYKSRLKTVNAVSIVDRVIAASRETIDVIHGFQQP